MTNLGKFVQYKCDGCGFHIFRDGTGLPEGWDPSNIEGEHICDICIIKATGKKNNLQINGLYAKREIST